VNGALGDAPQVGTMAHVCVLCVIDCTLRPLDFCQLLSWYLLPIRLLHKVNNQRLCFLEDFM